MASTSGAAAAQRPLTVVLKLGSSSIIDDKSGNVALSTLAVLIETIAKMKSMGHRVILVSSGAVGVGCQRMNLAKKPDSLVERQALAAIGQGRLMRVYDELFSYFSQPIAQVLITRGDLAERAHYLNARNTIMMLLDKNVVPIMNENDTIAVEELRFGDNDTLSALAAAMVDADWLFLLTDVDALYEDNPNTNPNAKAIRIVENIDDLEKQARIVGAGSQWGTGGMETKIVAARLATASGCRTGICKARSPGDMLTMLAGGRDVGTVFLPKPNPIRGTKRWISHGLQPMGELRLDAGAVDAVSRKSSLFAAGIVAVHGDFPAQSALRLCDIDGREIGRGLTNYSRAELDVIKGKKSREIGEALGYIGNDCVVHRDNIALLT
eukprot:Opistho-2@20290